MVINMYIWGNQNLGKISQIIITMKVITIIVTTEKKDMNIRLIIHG